MEHIIDNNEKTERKLLMTLRKADDPILWIRKMHRNDLDAVERIRESAEWNQTEADWHRLMHLEPEGCFVMVEKDTVKAATTLIGFKKTLAWIGMVLVDEKHRGRGIATRLVQHALNYARDQSFKTIRLDATPQGQPVYKKLGFTLDWNLNRWQIDDISCLPEVSIKNSGLQVHSKSDDLNALFALDNNFLKIDRSALLSKLAQTSHSVVSACNSEGKLKGYGMLRSGSFADYLGPIICTDPNYGPPLVSCLLKHRRHHRKQKQQENPLGSVQGVH